MIRFPCHCGHKFKLDDDQAGGTIQCPDCGRLNDVPSLDDLANLNPDGTFKFAGTTTQADPERLEELAYIYSPRTTDTAGQDIDLRNAPEDYDHLLAEIPLADEDRAGRPHAPQYDPETGELIRPFAVRPDPVADTPPQDIPMAKPAITYAQTGRHAPTSVGLKTGIVALDLLQPANAFVMFIVFLVLLFGGFMHMFLVFIFAAITIASGTYIPAWPANICFWLVVAHYGNTIQEIGPEQMDELPRPLRHLGIGEDIVAPFCRVMFAVLLCYAPTFVLLLPQWPERANLLALPFMMVGNLFFPAVLVTTAASGSAANLRPDRLMRVIGRSGGRYVALVALWTVLFPLYLWVGLGVDIIGTALNLDFTEVKWLHSTLVHMPAIVVAVYLAHYFCWQVGLLHRAGHDKFGWVWQEHEKALKARRKMRAQQEAARAARRAAAAGGPGVGSVPPSPRHAG